MLCIICIYIYIHDTYFISYIIFTVAIFSERLRPTGRLLVGWDIGPSGVTNLREDHCGHSHKEEPKVIHPEETHEFPGS